MSAPKTTRTQDFLLGPDRARSNLTSLHSGSNRDPKLQKEKMSMFKRHLATSRLRSDEAIRRKVEMLKEQRSLSNLSKSGIQKEMEAASKAKMEEELGRPVSSNEWPFVYFVVTLDQIPKEAEEMNPEHSTRTSQTARERQRFLTSRRRKIQEAREETERIREAGIDMGLRLEPIKPIAQVPDQSALSKIRTRPSLSRHPTTPVSSIGSRPEFSSYLNSHDDLADVEVTKRNLGYLIHDTLSQAGMPPKTTGRPCPINSLELPEISASAKRRALGTSNKSTKAPGLGERKVTFAEGLPVIKGNGIPVNSGVTQSTPAALSDHVTTSNVTAIPDNNRERSGRDSKKLEADESLRPPWSVPTTRSLNSLGQKSRLFAPMALPKVDIVSEIYDELIVKTIQNYLLAEGYSNDKLQQLRQTVLARLSATYPHLVKHRAWRLTHSPCDKLYTNDEEGEEVVMADPEKLQPRARVQAGKFNKVVLERGLTYDQMRPFTSPHVIPLQNEPMTQSFMAIDGRTMTFSSRDEIRLRSSGGNNNLLGPSGICYSKLPGTEADYHNVVVRGGDGGRVDNIEFENVNKSRNRESSETKSIDKEEEEHTVEQEEMNKNEKDNSGRNTDELVDSPTVKRSEEEDERMKNGNDEPETNKNDDVDDNEEEKQKRDVDPLRSGSGGSVVE